MGLNSNLKRMLTGGIHSGCKIIHHHKDFRAPLCFTESHFCSAQCRSPVTKRFTGLISGWVYHVPLAPLPLALMVGTSQVWLCDGQRAVDVGYFKDRPLSEFTKVGQQVTVAARSIVCTSGAGLKPGNVELQAIVVALSDEGFHEGVPRPSK